MLVKSYAESKKIPQGCGKNLWKLWKTPSAKQQFHNGTCRKRKCKPLHGQIGKSGEYAGMWLMCWRLREARGRM